MNLQSEHFWRRAGHQGRNLWPLTIDKLRMQLQESTVGLTPSPHDIVIAELRARAHRTPSGASRDGQQSIQMPPRVTTEMGTVYTKYIENKSLRARLPVRPEYHNPVGCMQGGMIAAAIDNVLGPLGYLVIGPSATTNMTVSFIRPVTSSEDFIDVEATVLAATTSHIFLAATVHTQSMKLVATAQACMVVLQLRPPTATRTLETALDTRHRAPERRPQVGRQYS